MIKQILGIIMSPYLHVLPLVGQNNADIYRVVTYLKT